MDGTSTLEATLDIADVRAAAERIAGAVVRTPTMHSKTLSAITGAEIWLKFENQQFTAAYKERGALNALLLLSEEQRNRGVIAASAGNHSQGLSYHGTRLGVPVTIVTGTPSRVPWYDRPCAWLPAEAAITPRPRRSSSISSSALSAPRSL